MVKNAYAVYDEKACFFGQPFFANTDNEAKRLFASAAQDTSSNIGLYPADFTLHSIGTYDDSTGCFTASQSALLGRGSDFVRKEV